MLYEEENVAFNAAQNLSDIQLYIRPNTIANQLPSNGSKQYHYANAPGAVWKEIESNRTLVFLHVVLMRAPVSSNVRNAVQVVDQKSISSGEALYGVVGLIKHDKIPRHFYKRYLLADVGWATMSPLEGMVPS